MTASGDASVPPTVAECKTLYAQAQADAAKAWERADKSCISNEDCVPASKAGCAANCSDDPIAKSALESWKKDREPIGAICAKCRPVIPLPIPTCSPVWPNCDHGTCVAGPRPVK
jgi:hypothetical protein